MMEFDRLVGTQLKTMDRLLDLQMELERYQHLEPNLTEVTQQEELQRQIEKVQQELHSMQGVFEQQTKQIIASFQKGKCIHN